MSDISLSSVVNAACGLNDAGGPLTITIDHAAGAIGDYQQASLVLGPFGLGKEIGQGLFGSGSQGGGGAPPPSPVAGVAGILLVLGGIAILMFAVHAFATHGGIKLFKV